MQNTEVTLAAICCIAVVKLNCRGERELALAAFKMACRTKLYANRLVQISRRTISGDLHRSTSMPSVILMARMSNSVCQS